jgi:argininosuccinate lyase
MKIWQKTENQKINKLVEEFTVGNDHLLDMKLIKYDIEASIAHAKGLERIGILKKAELKKLITALDELSEEVEKGKITIPIEDEDCHTYIEKYLTEKLGDAGKKIHTGRSRNDQVLTALQLYIQDNGKKISGLTKGLSQKFKKLALGNKDIPFPGYSHTQQAMITSLGHYYASFYESLKDDNLILEKILDHISKNPLGSAAGFGVNIPLDREFTTKELRFKSLQVNSLYCQNSRAKFQSLYLEALSQIMMTICTAASDMILYTTKEFSFFKVDSEFTTGSSIMPQKKNLDVLELVRGKAGNIFSDQLNIKILGHSLPSGYNRDYQLMKAPLFESTETVIISLEILSAFLDGISPDVKMIKSKIEPEIISADIAIELAKEKGLPFREAYKLAMAKVPKGEINMVEQLKKHISLGSAGNLGI